MRYYIKMDSLFDILGHKDFDVPPEVVAIKQYVKDEFNEDVEVIVREKDIVIAGRSAALISTLRLRGPDIKKAAKTTKRLGFRIG
jgi:hypothetical protein